jgi:hypothetical protein
MFPILPAIFSAVVSVSPAVASQIVGGVATFDSVYGNSGNPFEGGNWSNASGGSAWAEYDFAQPTEAKSIYVKMAGTDVTSNGSEIRLLIRDQAGWRQIYRLADKVINRGFSGGTTGPQIGPVRINLGRVAITGVRLEMKGHGWFAAEDIRVESP